MRKVIFVGLPEASSAESLAQLDELMQDIKTKVEALRDALAEPDETEAAVLAEREACAEAAEEWLPDSFDEITQVAIAAKIRARGEK